MGMSREDWLKSIGCVYEPNGAKNTNKFCINTGIYIPDSTFWSKITADITLSADEHTPTGTEIFFGCSEYGGHYVGVVDNNAFGVGSGTGKALTTGLTKQTLHIEGTATGISVTSGNETVSTTFSTFRHMYIMYGGWSGVGSTASSYGAVSYASFVRLYELKIFYGGQLVYELVPIKRLEDNVLTLASRGRFNLATTSFT